MRRRYAHAWLIARQRGEANDPASRNLQRPEPGPQKRRQPPRSRRRRAVAAARGRRQAAFVADALGAADVICLQEWFFEPRWHSSSRRPSRRMSLHGAASRRPPARRIRTPRRPRDLLASPINRFGPWRRRYSTMGGQASSRHYKDAAIGRSSSRRATCPLPMPPRVRPRRRRVPRPPKGRLAAIDASLIVLCGDFNENAAAPACRGLEARGWTNVAAAAATASPRWWHRRHDLSSGRRTGAHGRRAVMRPYLRRIAPPAASGPRLLRRGGSAPRRGAPRVADAWDPDFVDSDHTPVVAEFSFREPRSPRHGGGGPVPAAVAGLYAETLLLCISPRRWAA